MNNLYLPTRVKCKLDDDIYAKWKLVGIDCKHLACIFNLYKINPCNVNNVIRPILYHDKLSTVLASLLYGFIDFNWAKTLTRFNISLEYKEEDWFGIEHPIDWFTITNSTEATRKLQYMYMSLDIADIKIPVEYIDGKIDNISIGRLYSHGIISDDDVFNIKRKKDKQKMIVNKKLIIRL